MPAGAARQPARRLRRRTATTTRATSSRWRRRRSTPYTAHRHRPAAIIANRHLVLPRPARPEPDRRHRLLLVARRGAPGLREPAQRRVPTMALAGGVNLHPRRADTSIVPSAAAMLSPDGRCKAFDARANGYVRGEGGGVVVLKPLAAAAGRRRPRSTRVIRGTAVNQDGRTHGLTVPSGRAQESVLREALPHGRDRARRRSQYVEAHGTGTPVGDPIEAGALGTRPRRGRPPGSRCVIGSVKTNIGHLEAAAGIAGLIKAALALQHRSIPPQPALRGARTRDIDFDAACRLRVAAAARALARRRPPGPAPASTPSASAAPTPTSCSRTPAAPKTPSRHVTTTPPGACCLPSRPTAQARCASLLGYAAHPTAAGRGLTSERLPHRGHARTHPPRRRVAARSSRGTGRGAWAFAAGETGPAVHGQRGPTTPRAAFVFSGQGPQWWAMGRELLDQEPVFRAAIERCDDAVRPLADWSLIEELTRRRSRFAAWMRR